MALLLALALQQQDVLVYKNGDVMAGKILKVDADGVEFKFEKGGSGIVPFEDLEPNAAFAIKLKALDPKSAAARTALAEFARAHKLFSQAIEQFEAAKALEPASGADLDSKIESVKAQDAQSKLADATALMAKGELEKAGKPLKYVIEHYAQTAFGKQAEELLTQLASMIEAKNQKKAEQLAKAKEALEAKNEKLREALEKAAMATALAHIEDGKKFWGDGLDQEGAGAYAKAQQAWLSSVDRFMLAAGEIADLVKSNDIEMIKQAKALGPEISQWLVRAYVALGQMHATSGTYPEAIKWLNQAIKIDPDHAQANALKLEVTKAQLQKKP